MGMQYNMFQNHEILFAIGTLGTIISLILLLISLIKNIKILKVLSIILITAFVVTFSIGISLGYYYYENLKDINTQVNDKNLNSKLATEKIEDPKITSGNSEDPIVITEKTFSVDDNYFYSEFEVKNNTNIEISKISFDIMFTYKSKLENGANTEHVFLLDSVIPPNKTIIKNYLWKKNAVEQASVISNVKLLKIQNLISRAIINGEEKSLKIDDLKPMLTNKK